MGVKVKKQVKAVVSAEPDLQSKYTLAVPSMGLIVMATMGTYATGPLAAGNKNAMIVFVALAILGVAFSFCTYMWKATADARGIKVHSILKGERVLFYSNMKKVEVRKMNDTIISYTIINIENKRFLKMYLVMTNCGALLERLRKLGIKIVEV